MNRWKAPLLFLVLTTAGILAIRQGWLDLFADQQRIAAYLNGHGLPGLLAIAAAGALYTGLGGPRQLLAFVSGYAMGAPGGALFSTLVTTLGAAGCFYAARILLRPGLTRRFARRMTVFDQAVAEQPLIKILAIRLLPVGSNLLTNLMAGASGIRLVPFLTGSALGYLPQMLIFALTGAGLGSANQHQLLLAILLFAMATLIGSVLYRNHRARTLTEPLSNQT
ncbi:TVP38/TMEM64 family protein [Thiohalomonas denitrificans]|uniref:TVP38/TMEM64 family protein n=1 Tax=Thiohalomonas denitrificans TaxID=415747 RepID=UPI0026EA9284|nr:VTT domain-containing protein [Thiohalomonas denitrificans]